MPERRCTGCGRVAPKSDLVRLALEAAPAASPGPRRVLLDPRGVLPGRGGYLCQGDRPGFPERTCLMRALRRGGLSRAFRTAVTMPPDFVESTS